jgi:hypothetical protein
VIAVLLAHADRIAGRAAPHPPKAKKDKKPRKTAMEKEMETIEQLLQSTDVSELKRFLLETAAKNKDFRGSVLLAFAVQADAGSHAVLVRQIKAMISKHKRRYGFLHYQDSRRLANELQPLVASASQSLERGQVHNALFVCTALLETVVPLFNEADDSSGTLGGVVAVAMKLFEQIATTDQQEEIRLLVYNFVYKVTTKGLFSGWDWHLDCLKVAAIIVKPGQEAMAIQKLIEKEIKDSPDYMRQYAEAVLIDLLRRTDQKALDLYMKEHTATDAVVFEQIRAATVAQDYDLAKQIAEDGLQRAKQANRATNSWLELLVRIADELGDRVAVVDYASALYLHVNSDQPRWLAVMRRNTSEADWPARVYALVEALDQTGRSFDLERIASLYAELGDWKGMFMYLQAKHQAGRSVLYVLAKFEAELKDQFAVQMADIYEEDVREAMLEAGKRSHYADACTWIRRMKKLGAEAKATQLIADLRKNYPQRIALMDELDHV